MRDIQLVLERWGVWASCDGSGVDFPSIAAGFKGLIPSSKKSRASCCDDDGLTVSSAVNCLKKKSPYLCTLIEWHYVLNIPVRIMGMKLGISHTQVLKRLQSAEGFIDGCLAMIDVSLEMDRYTHKEPIPLPKRIPLTA